MRSDALLAFVPIGGNLSLVTGGANAVASTNVIDLMGVGVGVAPPNIIGNAAVFGTDMGIGGFRPEINCVTGNSNWAGGTSLTVALQGAVDSGAGGNYQPGTWITFGEVPGLTTAQLLANTVIGRLPWLPAWPSSTLPRYLRLLFTPVGTFTTGVIASAIVTTVRDDQANKFAAANYKVA
jgi:hypothetical protein